MGYDDVIIGGGHNGLTAAAYLARAGRRVLVLERADHVGGAAVSARPFPGVDARLSRYSYLVSLLPRQVVADLELPLQLVRRRYSSYTPVPGDPSRGLLVDNADPAATATSFAAVTGSLADHHAWQDFYARMSALASRVFPTVLEPLRSAAQMRDLVGDDELWDAIVQRPLGEMLRTTFADDTVRGVVATDALIGTFADLGGISLQANVCFLYHLIGGGTGDWDVPLGGMGALTTALASVATAAGATIRTGSEVMAVDPSGMVSWRDTEGEHTQSAPSLLAAVAPTVLDGMLRAAGAEPIAAGVVPEGSQLKVNMVLSRLPRLRGATDPRAAFAGTFHVNQSMEQLHRAYAAASAGSLPDPLPLEIYCHTLSDRSILGADLAGTPAQTLTLFGLHTPARLFRADNEAMRAPALRAALTSLDSVLGEPIRDVLMLAADGRPCIEVRTPVDLEQDLALPGGNIFHRSLQWPWAEREDEVGTWGVETAYPRLLLCGAGARRGGGVSGIPGHNASRLLLGPADRTDARE